MTSLQEKLARVLPQVTKPHRYVGEELNVIRKDLSKVEVKVALAFPEVYELGMSHIGLKILYHLCNQRPEIAAERVYCPWLDMEEKMREEKIPLFTMESKVPVSEFDVIGFSLQSEFTYTNVINMIDLAGCEVFARDRKETFPLFIAGGPCVSNPEPLADFMDAFLIGDGEELLLEFLEKLRVLKAQGVSKEALLVELAKIEGVYVPSLYAFTYEGPKVLEYHAKVDGIPKRVRRRYVKQLKIENYPDKPLVPALEITHDRLSLEIMRGCTQGCRFCQAGYWYRPVRELPVDDVLGLAIKGIKETGFSELSLCSLSTADYSGVNELSSKLNERLHEKKIAISLPSLRADRFSVHLADNVGTVRKSGFTFAPEAGSWRLRQVINKSITNEHMYEAADVAYQKGWDLIKLYVMIGLPTENQQDLEELVQIVRKINDIGRKYGRQKNVTVSTGAFVPKSFTPFQWEAVPQLDELQNRITFLKGRLINKTTRLKWHDLEAAYVEVSLSRGDRRMGQVLYQVWKAGARYDGWSQHFSYARWMKAFADAGVELAWYTRQIGLEEVLPWDVIDAWVSKKYLLKERQMAFGEGLTTDCKWGDCHYCGIKGAPKDTVLAKTNAKSDIKEPLVYHAPEESPDAARKGNAYRVKFAKRKELRYLSHLDLLRMFEMILRRAEVPLLYSQGFHQRPRIHFGPPLSVGLTSETEWADFELVWSGSQEALMEKLQRVSPPGFAILDLRLLTGPTQSLSHQYNLARYEVSMNPKFWEMLEGDRKLDAFSQKQEFWIEERRRDADGRERIKRVDMRKAVRSFHVARETSAAGEKILSITLSINDASGNNTNPNVFLKEVLCLTPQDASALDIRRVEFLSVPASESVTVPSGLMAEPAVF